MHALTTLGFLAIGALAVLVIFLEVRRKRHYIAYLLRHRPDDAPSSRRELAGAAAAGLFIAGAIVAALVLS